jgi:outer membrane protein assembly factor BamB/tetratricopeptide (TPR) repeat protein
MCRRRHHPNRRLPAAPTIARASLPTIVPFIAAAALYAQAPAPAGPAPQTGAILHESEEASHLMTRAGDAIGRQDWKLAIDALQRVVELSGDHLLRADDGRFIAARTRAQQAIAALPPEALAAYRLLYDGEAKTRYEDAVAAHDEDALRDVVDRLLLTRRGDDAAMTLAAWRLDAGRPTQAAALLHTLLTIYPDSDIPRPAIEARLAMALALSGQTREAHALAAAWTDNSDIDAPLRARLQEVTRILTTLTPVRPAVPHHGWPMRMGSPARFGLMPPVRPIVLEETPWHLDITELAPALLQGVEQYQKATGRLPVADLLTDGAFGVVKANGRLIVFDLDTFETLWARRPALQSRRHRETQRQAAVQRYARRPGLDWQAHYDHVDHAQRILFDSVENDVTLFRGLAITVGRSAQTVAALTDDLVREGDRDVFSTTPIEISDRLIAYDLPTGQVRWRFGMLRDSPADARPIELMAAPTPAADHLLVPYREGTDLYLAVLDPNTGRAVRRLYLCGLGAERIDSLDALSICAAGTTAYVPTNRGMLFAIDTTTWSIQWAAPYTRDPNNRPRFAQHDADGNPTGPAPVATWLPGPPIAAGGVVLLAPVDGPQLLAFDRDTGTPRWQLDRDEHLYLLGATERCAWIVGDTVTQIDLELGRPLWHQEVGAPTGRGAISGDRLYLPTHEGIAVLAAASGERIDLLATPHGHEPPGNLLAWRDSLYSCGLGTARRYPDIQQALASARAAHERHPTDPAAAFRLAQIQMIRGRPAQALATLDTATFDETTQAGARRAADAAAMRVNARLQLAEARDTPDADAIAMLEQAAAEARAPTDRIRVGLALAARIGRTGRYADAYRRYVDIALAEPVGNQPDATAPGDVLLQSSTGVARPARAIIAERLRTLEASLPPADQHQLDVGLAERLEAAIARGPQDGSDELWHFAEADMLPSVRLRARLQLGIWAQENERFEIAEQHFTALLREGAPDDHRNIKAEARARLAVIALAPAELHRPVTATQHLDALAGPLADATIPANVVNASLSGTMSGADAARQLRERIDARLLARDLPVMRGVTLGPCGDVAYKVHLPETQPLGLRGPIPEPLAAAFLTLSDWIEVRTYAAADGQLLWPAALRLLSDPAADVTPIGPSALRVQPIDLSTKRPYATRDGSVIVVNSDRGLHAIGLATGLRLWSQPYDPPRSVTTASDRFVWADAGRLLSLDANGTLTMADLADGRRIRWQRPLRAENPDAWAGLRLQGDYAVVVNATRTALLIFAADDGREIGTAAFVQPAGADDAGIINLVLFDDIVCGPAGRDTVIARELTAPGVERWRFTPTSPGALQPVTGLFKPAPNLLAIGTAGGIRLIDPATGRVRLDATLGDTNVGVFDGALTDDVLCLYATGPDSNQPLVVYGLDANEGRVLWRRAAELDEFWSQLGSPYPVDNSLLKAATNAIPVAQLLPPRGPRITPDGRRIIVRQPRTGLRLTILDKRTGEPLGRPGLIKLTGTDTRLETIDHVIVRPDRVIVVADSTYVAFDIP